jgi:hypothetical protein
MAMDDALGAVLACDLNWKVPSPLLVMTDITAGGQIRVIPEKQAPFETTTTSLFPSRLKSPTAMELGAGSIGISLLSKYKGVVRLVTWKKTTFETLEALGEFTTVMEAVPFVATLPDGTVAVNCEPLTNVVVRGTPFQSTVAPLTKPVPFTVRVKAGLPGTVVSGTRG